ncbi:unnamed protein product [Trichobilharzia szidati]|nr:unnamed protein product [Trichobilharzia szidati]
MTVEQRGILNLHNGIRDDINNRRIPGQPQPKSLGKYVWDSELQQTAAGYAKTCNTDVNTAKQLYNNKYGINIANGNDFKSAFDEWFKRSHYYNFEKNLCNLQDCSSYKQIVSDRTTHIGCSLSMCPGEKGSSEMTVCFYYPPADANGQPYKIDQRQMYANISLRSATPVIRPEATSYRLAQGRCRCRC